MLTCGFWLPVTRMEWWMMAETNGSRCESDVGSPLRILRICMATGSISDKIVQNTTRTDLKLHCTARYFHPSAFKIECAMRKEIVYTKLSLVSLVRYSVNQLKLDRALLMRFTSLSSGSHCDSWLFRLWSLLTICGFTNIISASFPYLSTFSVNSQLLSKFDRSNSSISCWVVKTCK